MWIYFGLYSHPHRYSRPARRVEVPQVLVSREVDEFKVYGLYTAALAGSKSNIHVRNETLRIYHKCLDENLGSACLKMVQSAHFN